MEESWNFRDAHSFQTVSYPQPLTLRFIYTHNELEPWHEVSFGKHGGQSSMSPSPLPLKSTTLIPTCKARDNVLMSLLPYIPPVYHTFYTDIPCAYDQEYKR
jgi:hypothetical protein